MTNFAELRDQAKALGINTYQMSKAAIEEAIGAASDGGIAPVKKGAKSWRWRNRFEVDGKDPNFRYRFVSREESVMREKMADGWEFVSPLTGVPGEHINPRQIADGEPLDGAHTYRDMVLMALPEEKAKLRDAAVADRTRQQTVGLKKRLQSDMKNPGGPAAEVHGNITIID